MHYIPIFVALSDGDPNLLNRTLTGHGEEKALTRLAQRLTSCETMLAGLEQASPLSECGFRKHLVKGKSIKEIARDLNISRNSAHAWRQAFAQHSSPARRRDAGS
jgi:FixJ family two-component response regulator